jgi:hypothetical protein
LGTRETARDAVVANIRVIYPLAGRPVSWHVAVDNKSVRIDMPNIRDYAGELTLSEWVRYMKEQVDELKLLAIAYEGLPTPTTKEAALSALDSMEGLLNGAYRSLEGKRHEAHRLRSRIDSGSEP